MKEKLDREQRRKVPISAERSNGGSPDADAVAAVHAESAAPASSPTDAAATAAKLADAEARVLRAQADLENFRKRVRREHEEQLKLAIVPLVADLLDVVDNLDRALNSAAQRDADDELTQGVSMIATQLKTALEKHGVRRIEALGQPFDPHLHQTVRAEPTGAAPNTVIEEVQPGYMLHDRVIRPARVVIAS